MQTQSFDLRVFQHLVAGLYETALEPEHWDDFLEQTAQACGVGVVVLQQIAGSVSRLQRDVDNALLVALVPHIRKAFDLVRRLRRMDSLQQASMELLENLSCGVILFSKEETPLSCNQVALDLCESNAELSLFRKGNDVYFRCEYAPLKDAIHHGVGGGGGPAEGAAFKLGDKDKALHLLVSPIGTRASLPTEKGLATAALFLASTQLDMQDVTDTFSKLFGLSRAESRLVSGLLKGFSIEEAADRFFVSKNTLRVQLQSVFKKTGARSQADLMRRMLNLPVTIRKQ